MDKVRITSEAEDAVNGNSGGNKTDGNGNTSSTNIPEKTIVVKDRHIKAAEQGKKVLTQGDKLNIMKARKQLSPAKSQDKVEQKEKPSDKTRLRSTRATKPNILPKRDGSSNNSR